ncbi:hypothetical protein [Streptomyces sp. HB132]|uniref:hypothetical protein n=1 Tax=Streptomyces sp. HB132 TaxID=767388 RepID=UPI001960BB61|nr:hypothetical protein [Streptomyces sp. HB132]MBM7439324.1 hypothetical protein [Streptomyces sp. HB132]
MLRHAEGVSAVAGPSRVDRRGRSRRGTPNINGIDKLRHAIEQTFALLTTSNAPSVRWERRIELHDGAKSALGIR